MDTCGTTDILYKIIFLQRIETDLSIQAKNYALIQNLSSDGEGCG